ncbi:MAG TPA: alpha/beta fold hydrolase [Chitinophagaceae bacterium]|nr:alpha/beta fold hydrolase [Chitinophagaceae bacterium]
MRKITIFTAMLLNAISTCAQTKDFSGAWEGTMNAGREITIIFHFTKSGNNTYAGTMDVPAQNAKNLALNKVTVKGDSLIAEMQMAGIVYKSALQNDSTLQGMWLQRGAQLPLTLKQIIQPVTAEDAKPQTPAPPYSYNSDDVEYDNADKSVHFGATFTYPKTGGPFATALLITGSGQQDRDETIFGHKPFAVLADYLTKKGYAVLRVDDRGIGKTTGTLLGVTSADFAADAEAGLAYLKTRPEVDKNKLGLIGHSEGGAIAPMVAAKHPELDFIVLWAGPIVGGLKTNVEQNAHSLLKAGIDTTAVNAFKDIHTKELQQFGKSADVSTLNKNVKAVYNQWKQQQSSAVLSQLYATDTTIIGKSIYSIYDGLYDLQWMRFFIVHSFADDLAKVHCKVLAINGDKDMQVNAAENLHAADSILRANKNPHYKTVVLKGLNHLLQPAVTGEVSEYGTIQTTIAPEALQTIGDWLDKMCRPGHKMFP